MLLIEHWSIDFTIRDNWAPMRYSRSLIYERRRMQKRWTKRLRKTEQKHCLYLYRKISASYDKGPHTTLWIQRNRFHIQFRQSWLMPEFPRVNEEVSICANIHTFTKIYIYKINNKKIPPCLNWSVFPLLIKCHILQLQMQFLCNARTNAMETKPSDNESCCVYFSFIVLLIAICNIRF